MSKDIEIKINNPVSNLDNIVPWNSSTKWRLCKIGKIVVVHPSHVRKATTQKGTVTSVILGHNMFLLDICKQNLSVHGESVTSMEYDKSLENMEICQKEERSQYVVLGIEAELVSLIMGAAETSKSFRNGCIKYLNNQVRSCLRTYEQPERSVYIVIPFYPRQCVLDYKWSYRICGLMKKRIMLDDSMNWLNTLGGGYSALGDYFVQHAEEAGRISSQQLQLAMQLGDPPTVIRCHLYFALSRMQQGHLGHAKKIIRWQYIQARSLLVEDIRLLRMCQGLWSRLKYMYTLNRKTNLTH